MKKTLSFQSGFTTSPLQMTARFVETHVFVDIKAVTI